MSKTPDRTSAPSKQPVVLERPSAGQVLRQLGMVVFILAIWAGALVGFVSLTAEPASLPTAEVPLSTATATPSPVADTLPPVETLPPASTVVPEASPPPALPETQPPPAMAVSFSQDVLPIFESRCLQCHGASRTEGGLALTDYQAVLAGSRDGPVLEPGDANNSILIDLIVSGDMPRRGPSLLPAEIEIVIAWVMAGAPDN